MTRKQLQRSYRLGLAALISSSVLLAEAAQAQQQPINRTAPAAQQQVQQQQPINQAATPGAGQQAPVAPPAAPFPPLSPQNQQYLDWVLDNWSNQTSKIDRYRSDFERWTFEGSPEHSKYAKGVLRYQKPDKGMFRVDDLYFRKDKNPDGSPNFGKVDGMFGEWWICDGKILHEFDRTQKTVTRYHLPPHMQGLALINSPLPFLFGVKKEDAKARYWLNPLPPRMGQDGKPIHYLVEAYPKTMADAQNYSRVIVTLDSQEFLPLALEIFLPNNTEKNKAVEHFQFSNREKNWTILDRAKDILKFEEEFLPLTPPKDWKIIEEEAEDLSAQPQDRAANQPAPNNVPRR